MEGNLRIYDRGKYVPNEARKPILGGRLKGMTSINPMWRIRTLTELYGPAGIGWYTDEVSRATFPGAGGEVVAQMRINLYVKDGDSWSKPIFGEGGALLVAQEKNGLRTNDEAWKSAYTDALSVACKALGIGADVYFAEDYNKYTEYTRPQEPQTPPPQAPQMVMTPEEFMQNNPEVVDLDKEQQIDGPVCEICGTPFKASTIKGVVYSAMDLALMAEKVRGRRICKACAAKK